MSFSIPFDFHQGDLLDGMTVIAPLVRGGHGDLYLVSEEAVRRMILKVIQSPDNEKEPAGIEKCRAVASHIPGLVPILKTGRLADGRFYCVMPPADNLAQWPDYEPDTLAGRIARAGRIPPEEVLRMADQLLATISALHEAGLAHCDVKPENVLFMDGEPKLTDYSLLSAVSKGASASSPCGSPGFVPPEMLDHPDLYDPKACDLYALGKVIYCAWSGEDAVVFPSVPREIPLREIGVMLPLYTQACSSSPGERFKNAAGFVSAIAAARGRLHSRLPVRGGFLLGRLWWIALIGLLVLGSTFLANYLFYFVFHTGDGDPDPLEVTTTKDVVDPKDGVNSFREALMAARGRGIQTITFNMPDGDAIRLNEPSLITREMRFARNNRATGNPVDIVLDHLRISKQVTSTPDTFEGGGAALYADGGRFTIVGGEYAENVDRGTGGIGGAIRIVNGSLNIDGVRFRENAAYSAGGAVKVNDSELTIRKSTFIGNASVGHGGAVDIYCSTAKIVDTAFALNSTQENPLYNWRGGAIQVAGSDLIYEVTAGTTIADFGNSSGLGGFMVLSGVGGKATAEFRIDGTLNIGRGDGRDSFASLYRADMNPDNKEKTMYIRKTGSGVMTVDAPVSDYDEQWIVEDGVLAFRYARGGNFDGEIVISGGQLRLDSPHKFNRLVFLLGSEPNALPLVNNVSNLRDGTFIADVSDCADGKYPLADGADGFTGTVGIRTSAVRGGDPAELSVGQTVAIGDSSCTLDLDGDVLSLTVRSAKR